MKPVCSPLPAVLATLLFAAPALPAQTSATSLTIAGLTQSIHLDAARLAAMPQVTVTVENGHNHMRETYTGVPLIDLLAQVGAPTDGQVKGKALSEYIVAVGSDGYKAVLALAEAEPVFHPGQVLVAEKMDGKPLDPKQGPFKLVISEDKFPARSVHNLVKVELHKAE